MKVLQNAKNASKTHQNPFVAGGAQNAPSDPMSPHRLHFPPIVHCKLVKKEHSFGNCC